MLHMETSMTDPSATHASVAKAFHLLVVEDSPGDVILLRKQLEKGGGAFEMRTAKDGVEMLSRVIDTENNALWPDVIILDINMPRVTGLQALDGLRNDPMTKAIPILMLTSSRAEQDINKARAFGAQGYMIKGSPVNLDAIVDFAKTAKQNKDMWMYVGQ